MRTRTLGRNGPALSLIGLGCMGMSDFYGPADTVENIATIHAALEAGITLLDTGDFYGMGRNELLLREALKGGKRDRVFLQVKFGAQRDPAGAFIDETTLARARGLKLDPARYLDDNNSTEFFSKLGDLLMPGPTYTNVNDFRAILVDRP